MDMNVSCFESDLDYDALVHIDSARKRPKPTFVNPKEQASKPFTFSYATVERSNDEQRATALHNEEEQSTCNAQHFGIREDELEQLVRPFLRDVSTTSSPNMRSSAHEPLDFFEFSITDSSSRIETTQASTSSTLQCEESSLNEKGVHTGYGFRTEIWPSGVRLHPVAPDATDSNKRSIRSPYR